VAKKSAFLAVFLLTLFENTLKYTYVSQQANVDRQQLAPFPVGGDRYSGEPHVFVSADTHRKAQSSLSPNVVVGDPE